ncbi:MAG: DUF2298 domain-containing protein [Chloroflexota bacterium]
MTASERAPTVAALLLRGDPAAAGAALILVMAGLLAAWLVPLVSLVVIWPLLFVVPGWVLVAVMRPRIATTGRIGLAVVLSVALSAHLVYWLSLLLGGYTRGTIFVAAGLLAAPLVVVAWRSGIQPFQAQLGSTMRAVRRNAVAIAVAALSAAFVGLVLDSSLWHPTSTGVSAGGSNWSDLGVHLSIAQSMNAGNFPPQVPYFAGAPLVYHWFADFHAAIAAKVAGLFAVPVFVTSSAILTGALALLVHGLARTLLRGRGARRAAVLAMILVVFGGGLGWVRLVGDVSTGVGDPIALVTANSYDNSWYDAAGNGAPMWPFFRIPSVMGTGLLVHRATTLGLPILVGAVLLLVAGLPTRRARRAGWRDRPLLILMAGVLGALLAPFHFFFFPAFGLVALLYVLIGGRLLDRDAPRNAALLLAPYVLAAPFVLAPLFNASGSGALKVALGWESAPLANGPWAVAFFYVTNLGVPFVLGLAALFVRDLRARAFLGAWALALFLVPNLVQVSEVAFDMNKFFQAMWIAVALLAAGLIRRWAWPAIAAVLLLSVPSPLLIAAYTAFDRQQVLDWNDVAAANWMAANTPERSVFATDGWLNSPTDPAGRLRLLTYPPYVANLGFDPSERAEQVREIYCAGDVGRTVAVMRQLGATYLLDGGRPGDCATPTEFVEGPDLHKVYENDALRIWQVVIPAAASDPQAVRDP